MPGRKGKHTAKWDRCVAKAGGKNPYAVCTAALGKGSFTKGSRKA